MKNVYFLVLLASLGFISLSRAQEKPAVKEWDLQECITYAIDHNIDIKQQLLALEESKIDIKGAKGAFLPDLNGGIRNSWNSGLSEIPTTGQVVNQQNRVSSYGVNSNIPIYNGMRNYHTLQQAKLQQVASELSIEKAKDDLKINIANGYLQVLLQKENIEILKAQYKLTLHQLQQSQEMVKAGSLPKGEVLQLEATAADDVKNITEAENSYDIAILGLKQLLNFDLAKEIQLKKQEVTLSQMETLEKPINAIVNKVIDNRNEVKLSKANIDVAKKGIDIAKGNLKPSLSGFVNLDTREQDLSNSGYFEQLRNNVGVAFGLNLNVPIFNRFQNKNAIAKRKLNVLRSENQLTQVKQQVTQDVYQAYLNAKASYKTYQASQKTVAAQKLAFDYQQTSFDVGQSNLLDYTQNKIRFQNSQTELIKAKYDLLFRMKLLELYYEN